MSSIKQKNFWLQIAGLILVLIAVFLPKKEIVFVLVSQTSERFESLLAGATLLKLSLMIDGLLLLGLGLSWYRIKYRSNKGSLLDSASFKLPENRTTLLNWLVLGLLLTMAFILRIIKLNQGMWYDEVVTLVHFVRPPFGEIITNYSAQNQHFLYSIFAHFSILTFGESIWALRLPAVLFGVGSIWALYALAMMVTDKKEAMLAATMLTLSYHHIWFSQNARGYIGLLFLTLITTWLFIRGLEEGRWSIWISYAVGIALGLYIHLSMAFVLISHVIIYGYVFLKSPSPRYTEYWKPFLAFCLVGLFSFQLYSLVIPQVFQTIFHQGNEVSSEWTNPIWTLMETIRGLKIGFATSFGVLGALVLFGAGLISYARKNLLVVMFLVLPGLIGIAISMFLQRNVWPRFFFYVIGFGILVLIRGANVLGQVVARVILRRDENSFLRRNLGMGFALIIVLLSVWSLRSAYYPKQDYIGARTFIENMRQDNEPIVSIGYTSIPWQIYFAPNCLAVETLEQLNTIKKQSKRTWLVYTFPIYMKSRHPEIYESIQNDFTLINKFPGTLGDGTIYVCLSKPVSGDTKEELPEFEKSYH